LTHLSTDKPLVSLLILSPKSSKIKKDQDAGFPMRDNRAMSH
jgi:hypothetical protein